MSADEDTELRDLVAQTLETSGVLGKIRAELRASVFLALEEQNSRQKKTSYVNQELQTFLQSKDGITTASLVLEFLNFFNLDFSAAVFSPEAGLEDRHDKRDELRKKLDLGSAESIERKPLIWELLRKCRNTGKDDLTPLSVSAPSRVLPESLIEAQISDAKQKFEFYDKDKSGSIDKDELRNLFIDVFPHFHRNMLDRYVNDEFAAGDKDFSDGIEFDEFLGMYKRLFIICRRVVANDGPAPVAEREPAIGSANNEEERPKVNGSVDLSKQTLNQGSLPQSRSRSSSEERDEFFDEPVGGSGTGRRLGRDAPPTSPPRSPAKGGGALSSLSDAPSLFGSPGAGALLGSPPITGKPARSPDWKDLAEMDSKIARLNFGDPESQSEERRTPGDGDGKKPQDAADDYEDDFQSSSPGSPSPSPEVRSSRRSREESVDNSISEDIPEELSGDDDFLASSQEKMDDLTTDRSLSQFSQGGDIDYMEEVQTNK